MPLFLHPTWRLKKVKKYRFQLFKFFLYHILLKFQLCYFLQRLFLVVLVLVLELWSWLQDWLQCKQISDSQAFRSTQRRNIIHSDNFCCIMPNWGWKAKNWGTVSPLLHTECRHWFTQLCKLMTSIRIHEIEDDRIQWRSTTGAGGLSILIRPRLRRLDHVEMLRQTIGPHVTDELEMFPASLRDMRSAGVSYLGVSWRPRAFTIEHTNLILL